MAVIKINSCCEDNLPPYTGYCVDGEIFTCTKCGAQWEHSCDEAEGCCWNIVSERESL